MSQSTLDLLSPKAKRRSTFRLQPVARKEFSLQEAVAKLLTIEFGPPARVNRFGVCWFSIDHATYGGRVPGARVARGIVGGLPDMFILCGGRCFMIELKVGDGQLSEEQRAVCVACISGGGACAAINTIDAVLPLLDQWRIPRHNRTTMQNAPVKMP